MTSAPRALKQAARRIPPAAIAPVLMVAGLSLALATVMAGMPARIATLFGVSALTAPGVAWVALRGHTPGAPSRWASPSELVALRVFGVLCLVAGLPLSFTDGYVLGYTLLYGGLFALAVVRAHMRSQR
jgi:hypothetical protein